MPEKYFHVNNKKFVVRFENTRFSEEDEAELVEYIICNPDMGDLLLDRGGIRKLRWRPKGRKTKGPLRVVYFNYDQETQDLLIL